LKKLADYEALGIVEYWIVDYLALGASRYTGKPKQPGDRAFIPKCDRITGKHF